MSNWRRTWTGWPGVSYGSRRPRDRARSGHASRERARLQVIVIKVELPLSRDTWRGAGDENRTRTISLGTQREHSLGAAACYSRTSRPFTCPASALESGPVRTVCETSVRRSVRMIEPREPDTSPVEHVRSFCACTPPAAATASRPTPSARYRPTVARSQKSSSERADGAVSRERRQGDPLVNSRRRGRSCGGRRRGVLPSCPASSHPLRRDRADRGVAAGHGRRG
jgi:hypothetical protein